jgi:hypothetical protein
VLGQIEVVPADAVDRAGERHRALEDHRHATAREVAQREGEAQPRLQVAPAR